MATPFPKAGLRSGELKGCCRHTTTMSEINRDVTQKREQMRIKITASAPKLIYGFLSNLEKIYGIENLSVSQLLPNDDGIGFHIFCKIIVQPVKTMDAKEIKRQLESPEEPPLDKEV